MGRTHRPGQPRTEVEVYVYRHTKEVRDALDDAVDDARFAAAVTREPLKLTVARYEFPSSSTQSSNTRGES